MISMMTVALAALVMGEPAARVTLVGATDDGRRVTIQVGADGSMDAGEPQPIAWPEGWEGRHVSNLHAAGSMIVGYDHHTGALLHFAHDLSSVSRVGLLEEVRGTVRRRGMAVTPAGGVLVLDAHSSTLRVVDDDWAGWPLSETTLGTTPLVRLGGLGVVEAFAFSDDGALYAVGSGADAGVLASRSLYTVSLNTGDMEKVADLPVRDLDALTWARDGMLYATDADGTRPARLWRIDPETGATEDLGEIGAFTITALGEQATAWRLGMERGLSCE